MYKSRKEPPGYWQHRGNGFNYRLGYSEGKIHLSSGLKERSINIVIKDGRGLNK